MKIYRSKKTFRPTVTIGIPAYNEVANIGRLLRSLLHQQDCLFEMKRIIVIDDDSQDGTAREVQSVESRKILLIRHEERKGQNETENEIITHTDTDILILINADVLPANEYLLEHLVLPITQNPYVGIVGAATHPTHPRGFIERVIAFSHLYKVSVYEKINQGDTVYLCHGRCKALTRNLYQQMRIPDDCPEDAYSYLYCIMRGLLFVYVPQALALFKSPTTMYDHYKQSARFFHGKEMLETQFGKAAVESCYRIPLSTVIPVSIQTALGNPFLFLSYLTVMLVLHFYPQPFVLHQSRFDASASSKSLPL